MTLTAITSLKNEWSAVIGVILVSRTYITPNTIDVIQHQACFNEVINKNCHVSNLICYRYKSFVSYNSYRYKIFVLDTYFCA